ncbi:MAG: STAS domain-containing protein [Candidatus Limnocylindria bacterium]
MEVRLIDDRSSAIDIVGELTGDSEQPLADAHEAASRPSTKLVVLNFSGLEYMNSTGIGLLVTMLIRAQRQGQRVVAYGLDTHYREIFSLTRLDEAIGIVDTEADALAHVTA